MSEEHEAAAQDDRAEWIHELLGMPMSILPPDAFDGLRVTLGRHHGDRFEVTLVAPNGSETTLVVRRGGQIYWFPGWGHVIVRPDRFGSVARSFDAQPQAHVTDYDEEDLDDEAPL